MRNFSNQPGASESVPSFKLDYLSVVEKELFYVGYDVVSFTRTTRLVDSSNRLTQLRITEFPPFCLRRQKVLGTHTMSAMTGDGRIECLDQQRAKDEGVGAGH